MSTLQRSTQEAETSIEPNASRTLSPQAPGSPAGTPSASPEPRRNLWRELGEIGTDLWRYRELLFQLTRRDIRIRYKQAVMGFGWAVFMPIFVVGAGILVRLAMATLSHSELKLGSVAGLAVKSLPWSFFVGSLGFATNSLIGNSNLVSKIYFPREVLPLSVTLAQGFDTLIGAIAMTIFLALTGITPTLQLIWVPILALVLFMLTLAAGLLVSCANLFFRDVKYIVQVLITFGIFFTPVFFEPAMFGPLGAKLMMLNPLAPILEGLRLTIIQGHNLLQPLTETIAGGPEVLAWTPWYLAYSVTVGVLGLFTTSLLFHRLEFVFAEYI